MTGLIANRVSAVPAVRILGRSQIEIWGEASDDRLRRSFEKIGLDRFLNEVEAQAYSGDIVLVRADIVLDAPVLNALANTRDIVLVSTGPQPGVAVAAHVSSRDYGQAVEVLRGGGDALPDPVRTVSSEELGASYWAALRKREVPYVLTLTQETARAAEWRMFMGTYKGATDFVTKWVWPRPAFVVTKVCARLGLTPNMVTAVSLLFVIAAFYWFLEGRWAAGLTAAWLMTFLDTVDGKLARVTLNSSKFGNFFDHSIDLVHPPFWYVAWGLGLANGPVQLGDQALTLSLAIIVAGYLGQRVIEGLSIFAFKIEIHIWRPIDTWFRQVTARRNPNLVLLTIAAALGRADWGLVAVAAWTAICLLLHILQLAQAYFRWRRDGTLDSWMARPGAS